MTTEVSVQRRKMSCEGKAKPLSPHVAAQLTGVTHVYSRTSPLALDDVTLAFPERWFTAIIGPSGAGKSTLLRTLNALLKPSCGEVWVAGMPLGSASAGELRRVRSSIGMVFQHFNLVRRLSALENVLLGRLGTVSPLRSAIGLYPRTDRELAWALLERVGLADYAWQRADTLSGGQQQRVGIARALAQRPHLILADEPVSALDAKSAEEVMALLHEITQEDGIAVVANLHTLDFVTRYADRIVGLNRGRVVFEGRPSELTPEVSARIYTTHLSNADFSSTDFSKTEGRTERERGPPTTAIPKVPRSKRF